MNILRGRPFLGCSGIRGRQGSSLRAGEFKCLSEWAINDKKSMAFQLGDLFSSWSGFGGRVQSIDEMTHISWKKRPHWPGEIA